MDLFTKKLVLATLLVLGVVASGFAQLGFEFWTGDDSAYASAQDQNVMFGFSKFDSGSTDIFVYDADKKVVGSTVVFFTIDNGVTFKKKAVTFKAGYASVSELIGLFDANKFVAAKGLLMSINGKVYTFPMDNFLNAFQKFDDYKFNANPFGNGGDNPFGNELTQDNWVGSLGLDQLNSFDLDSYVDIFIADATRFGVDVSHVMEGKVYVHFDGRDEYILENPLVIAYTDALGDDNEVHIVVNPKLWAAASPAKRLAIMYHELGHDVLNLDHKSDKGPLMSVYAQEDYTFDQLYSLRLDMFTNYLIDN